MSEHMRIAHPGEKKNYEDIFRFEVLSNFKSAFSRQLGEAILMKNSGSIIMNLKEEYSRCIVPDINLGERGWREGGAPQRESAKFSGEVKMRESKEENTVRTVSSTDDVKPSRRKRMIEIKFKMRRKRKLHREKYEKITRMTSKYSRNEEEVWRDLIEKSKQMKYEEDFKKINRSQGIKRKRDAEKQEKKRIREKENQDKNNRKGRRRSVDQTVRKEKHMRRDICRVPDPRVAWSDLMNLMQQNELSQNDKVCKKPDNRANNSNLKGKIGIRSRAGFFTKLKPVPSGVISDNCNRLSKIERDSNKGIGKNG